MDPEKVSIKLNDANHTNRPEILTIMGWLDAESLPSVSIRSAEAGIFCGRTASCGNDGWAVKACAAGEVFRELAVEELAVAKP